MSVRALALLLLAAVPAFALNRSWTWNDRKDATSIRRQAAIFWVTVLVGLVVSTLVVSIVSRSASGALAAGIASFATFGALWLVRFLVLDRVAFDESAAVDATWRWLVARRTGIAADVITRLRALFGKKGAVNEPVDLNEATREVVALSQSELRKGRVILREELADDLPPVTGDRVQLQQVILNLLLNAHEATPSGGMARVEVAVNAGRAIVAVVDTGPGVPPELLERVFDPFFSTKERGSGLGLAICASIVQTHGGGLKAANREVGGAVFTVEFPLAVGATAAVPA